MYDPAYPSLQGRQLRMPVRKQVQLQVGAASSGIQLACTTLRSSDVHQPSQDRGGEGSAATPSTLDITPFPPIPRGLLRLSSSIELPGACVIPICGQP